MTGLLQTVSATHIKNVNANGNTTYEERKETQVFIRKIKKQQDKMSLAFTKILLDKGNTTLSEKGILLQTSPDRATIMGILKPNRRRLL